MNLNKLSEMSEEDFELLTTAINQEKQKRFKNNLKVFDIVLTHQGFSCVIKDIYEENGETIYVLYYTNNTPENCWRAKQQDFTISNRLNPYG